MEEDKVVGYNYNPVEANEKITENSVIPEPSEPKELVTPVELPNGTKESITNEVPKMLKDIMNSLTTEKLSNGDVAIYSPAGLEGISSTGVIPNEIKRSTGSIGVGCTPYDGTTVDDETMQKILDAIPDKQAVIIPNRKVVQTFSSTFKEVSDEKSMSKENYQKLLRSRKNEEELLRLLILAGIGGRFIAENTNIPPKRIAYILDKWSGQGKYEWGVNVMRGWMIGQKALFQGGTMIEIKNL